MATIEKGEYFIVSKGHELGEGIDYENMSNFNLGLPIVTKERNKRYDRSYEGDVYICLESCYPAVVGKLVFCTHSYHGPINKLVSFNGNDCELWPVTREYVKALGVEIND